MQNYNYAGGSYQPLYDAYAQMYYSQQPTTPYPTLQPQPVTPQLKRDTAPPHGMLPLEQSYIENILRLNKGKFVSVYCTFENNSEWNAKKFDGIIEAAGRDHLILSEKDAERRVLLPMVYVDYVVFYEEMLYEYPEFSSTQRTTTYYPR